MSRVFFRQPLEAAATFWRIRRRDGVTLGLTSHDHDLRFDGVVHRASPGMVPSAIRRTADLSPDSAEVAGALAHGSLSAADLASGRFDGAGVDIGVVDWETLDRAVLFRGRIGTVAQDADSYQAELLSAKAALEQDLVPRTSPTCRAEFCSPGCTLSAARFTHDVTISAVDHAAGTIAFAGGPTADDCRGGYLRWLDGPHVGLRMDIVAVGSSGECVLAASLDPGVEVGARAEIRQGCDHTIETCAQRFANSVNFQGEPFVPGNDFLARYPIR